MCPAAPSGAEPVRTAEVIGALSLATDLGMALPFEHGLQSTLFAMRLGRRVGADADTLRQTYYACLLFHAGCTTDAHVGAQLFGGNLVEHQTPVIFGSPLQAFAGTVRALPAPDRSAPVRLAEAARRLPRMTRVFRPQMTAMCEVAEMLAWRLGLPPAVPRLFVHLTDRWDGSGPLRRAAAEGVPLPMRIVHVARDACMQRMLGGPGRAAQVVGRRAGAAFDPQLAGLIADEADELLELDGGASAWEETLASEPAPHLTLEDAAVDRALAAMGDFADLASPHFGGHSSGVAALASGAARRCGLDDDATATLRRAALVHDLGRVAVHPRTWNSAGRLSPAEAEQVRLHPYHTERVLARAPALTPLAPLAGAHHERLDGSGYHRGSTAPGLPAAARLLAAADAFHAMLEPRAHRPAMEAPRAAEVLTAECRAGLLDGDAVAGVLAEHGQPAPRVPRPAGLTEREVEVVRLLARGRQTKAIARELGISAKTADRHVQNAYGKIGVSTRAAATLFAMQHGLLTWGELPMAASSQRP